MTAAPRLVRLLTRAVVTAALAGLAAVWQVAAAEGSVCSGHTITYDGGGDVVGGQAHAMWHETSSWDLGRVPTADDVVCIPDLGGDVGVRIVYGVTAQARSIQSHEAPVVESGAHLHVAEASRFQTAGSGKPALHVAGGTFTTDGDVAVVGQLRMSGTLGGSGTVTVRDTSEAEDLKVHSYAYLRDDLSLVLEGDTAPDNVSFGLGERAALTVHGDVLAGGTTAFSGTSTARLRLTGAATYVKDGDADVAFDVPVVNAGSITARAGALRLRMGSPQGSPGSFTALPGATLSMGTPSWLVDPVRLAPGASLDGVTLDGAVELAGATTGHRLTMTAGTVSGAGSLTMSGVSSWVGGALDGEVVATVPVGATLTLGGTDLNGSSTGSGTLSGQAHLQVAGTLVQRGSLQGTDAARLTVSGSMESRGYLHMSERTLLQVAPGGSLLGFAGADQPLYGYARLDNDGAVRAESGRWNLGPGWSDQEIPVSTGSFGRSGDAQLALTGYYSWVSQIDLRLGAGARLDGATLDGARVSLETSLSARDLSLTGGTITGTGTLTLDGTQSWTGGTIAGSVAVDVPGGSTLRIGGTDGSGNPTGSASLGESASLHVAGTAVTRGAMDLSDSALVSVTGTMDVHGHLSSSGSARLHVATGGVLRGFGGVDQPLSTFVRLENDGTVRAESGRWELSGTSSGEGGVPVSNGTFTRSGDAVLALVGGYYWLSDADLRLGTGARMDSATVDGARVSVEATVPATDLALTNGSITGAGTLRALGTLRWTGGEMTGTGTTVVPAGSLALLTSDSSSGHRSLGGRRLVVNGSARVSSGYLSASSGSIDVGGTLELEDGAHLSGNGLLYLAGVLRKSGGSGAASMGMRLDNEGTVEALAGTLTLSGGLLNATAEGSLVGGTWRAATGGVLELSDHWLTTIAGRVVVDGPASAVRAGWGSTGSLLSEVTEVAAAGAVELRGGRDEATTGELRNRGLVRLGAGSDLSVAGAYTQASTGTLATGLSDAGEGRLLAAGPSSLAGVLSLERAPTFDPAVGSAVQPLSHASSTGSFSAVTGTAVDPSKRYAVRYEPTGVRLVVEAIADGTSAGSAALRSEAPPVSSLTASSVDTSARLAWTTPSGSTAVVRMSEGTTAPATPGEGTAVRSDAEGTDGRATARSLKPSRPYAFSVFAVDALGRASAPRTVRLSGSDLTVRWAAGTQCAATSRGLSGKLVRVPTRGPLASQALLVESRTGNGRWKKVGEARTRTDGSFRATVPTGKGATLRVRYAGRGIQLGDVVVGPRC